MLAVVPVLNQQNSLLNTAMAQGYDKYGDNSYYSQYPTDEKNMNVEQVHSRAFL
jgi:hypothetical protein